MKTKNIILIIVLIAAALGIWIFVRQHNTSMSASGQQGHHDIWYCPMHPHYTSDRPGVCPICQMKLVKKLQQQMAESKKEKKILYWTDTMMPGYKSDHPGKSPMGMDMTPVYENDSVQQGPMTPGYATISVTAQKQQLIGLRTMNVERKPAVKIIRAYGVVSSDLQLYQIQDEFINAYVEYIKNERDYKRIRGRRSTWQPYRDIQVHWLEARNKLLQLGFSEKEIGKLQNVTWFQVLKQPGVQPELLMFNDSRSYWVIAQIFEQDFKFVKVEQEAEVNISAYQEKTKGVIRAVGRFIDPTSRSVSALIELSHYNGELAANMLTDIIIPVKLEDALFVPREAVMDTGLRKIVFVQKDGETFEPRDIQTVAETDDGFEIKSGLKEGERIVVSGNFLLDSESRVQAGLQESMKVDTTTAPGKEAHGQ